MALNPLDIQQKTFRVAIRGYAEDEVDDFLDEVVMAIREYEQKLADGNDEMEVLRARLDENRETEDALRKTLLAAQRTADQIIEEARRDSERILSDARADALRMTMEQGIEKNQLVDELSRLREIVNDVKGRLADIASDVNTRIDSVASDLDDAEVAYGRWEDSYSAPPQSAIAELRAEEEIDDDDDDDPDVDSSTDDADGDYSLDDGEQDDALDEDEASSKDGEYEPLDLRDSADAEGDDDDVEEVDTAGDYVDSSSTSSARRPWERYDD